MYIRGQHLSPLLLHRTDSRFAPSQWETALLSNDFSHWLDASQESALLQTQIPWHLMMLVHQPPQWWLQNLICFLPNCFGSRSSENILRADVHSNWPTWTCDICGTSRVKNHIPDFPQSRVADSRNGSLTPASKLSVGEGGTPLDSAIPSSESDSSSEEEQLSDDEKP